MVGAPVTVRAGVSGALIQLADCGLISAIFGRSCCNLRRRPEFEVGNAAEHGFNSRGKLSLASRPCLLGLCSTAAHEILLNWPSSAQLGKNFSAQ